MPTPPPGPVFVGALGETLTFVGLSAVSGLVAAAAMTVPMATQEDGYTPAYIAAAALRRTTPDDVSTVAARLVHYGAGVLSGVLYAVAYAALSPVLPATASAGSLDALPHALATAAVVGFVYVFFAHVVLPRAGASVHEERSTAVRGQWLRSSLVFGATLVVVLPLVTWGL
ncbi:hypothetical protein NDI76_12300 [Halogeometricum sp. S1BR25-6]|uniref:Integral membrane protein n=1 Tax=Halogeometricum salsisoli TaxID=2950536 RepID=A0ABU2GGT2_9EURY|nr:hypothetical protein [Halogeometricum sp. S1BR25-6]MDS0299524.1 hypothetical protein [Halogeometricum sp. S1BR25-6]